MGSFESDFGEMTHDVVSIQRKSGYDQWGRVVESAPTEEFTGMVVNYSRMMRDFGGNELRTRIRVFLPGEATLHIEDEVTLANGEVLIIKDLSTYPDETGKQYAQVLDCV